MVFAKTNLGRIILDTIAGNNPIEKSASSGYKIEEANKISEGLAKVASLPYRGDEAFNATREMMKIASDCISSIVSSLKAKEARVADLEKAAEVRCIVDEMVDSGMMDKSEINEKVAELIKKSSHDLEVTKEAIKLASKSKGSNVFFEAGESDSSHEKRGMFDEVIQS